MKKVYVVLCVLCVLILAGCNGRDRIDNGQEKNTNKESEVVSSDTDNLYEVVFLNYVLDVAEHDASIDRNSLISSYTTGYPEEALFAFALRIEYLEFSDPRYAPEGFPIREEGESADAFRTRYWDYTSAILETTFHEEGLYLLKDESQGYVVVGTMDDLRRVFEERETTEGWHIRASSAVRPDMDEILEQAGWTPDMVMKIDRMEWFEKNYDSIKDLLGTDARDVVLTVELR
jgi:hypothetical protein